MAHEGLRPSGWGKGEFPVKTWPPLNLLFWCWETWIPASRKGECGWENSTEYHCTPTEVFLSFHSRWDVLRLLQLWLKAQAIQLAQGPIKPTGSIYRAQLGVKRCSGICLLVGTSGKGLGCSLTLEPVNTNQLHEYNYIYLNILYIQIITNQYKSYKSYNINPSIVRLIILIQTQTYEKNDRHLQCTLGTKWCTVRSWSKPEDSVDANFGHDVDWMLWTAWPIMAHAILGHSVCALQLPHCSLALSPTDSAPRVSQEALT